ncbi:MAG: anthranilate phosphoribosyltransferase [Breznakibacter sp.]
MIKQTLKYLFEYKTLGREQAREILLNIAKEQFNHSEMVAFLSVYMMRPITVEELSGFMDALKELGTRVDLRGVETIDLCGTGGDGKNTFNISTLSSFVVAGAGIKVAKHGNYGVSSNCGSSNVLESLGYRFTADQETLNRQLDQANICFLHAPLFNQAMKVVAPIRRELGIKTFFNMLGPLVNPANPKNQMSGVYNLELGRLYNYLFQQTDKRYAIVHALDGYDEVSLTGAFKIFSNQGERIVQPADWKLPTSTPEQISGGETIGQAKEIFLNVLEGKGTPAQNAVVVANSAIAIQCAMPQLALEDAMTLATDSLMGQKALQSVKKLIDLSK